LGTLSGKGGDKGEREKNFRGRYWKENPEEAEEQTQTEKTESRGPSLEASERGQEEKRRGTKTLTA